jgi:hypothetical protein
MINIRYDSFSFKINKAVSLNLKTDTAPKVDCPVIAWGF